MFNLLSYKIILIGHIEEISKKTLILMLRMCYKIYHLQYARV